MTEGDTLMNALVGGVVAVFTAPIFPFSPIAGGAVAGYLEGGEFSEGAVVGAIAGVLSLIPLVLLLGFVGGLSILGPLVAVPANFAAFGFVVAVFALVFSVVYTVGFAAVGGVIGVYLKTETDLGS